MKPTKYLHTRTGAMLLAFSTLWSLSACAPGRTTSAPDTGATGPSTPALTPVLITEAVAVDSDDPAIWVNLDDPSQSLILGTDKGGAIYVFDLDGQIIPEKTVSGLSRMNNVDIEYGMVLAGEEVDIAVASDRDANLLRAYRVPEMTPIDNGGLPAFAGQEPMLQRPMGVALYKRPSDGAIFAIVSRKTGPSGAYLWQYLLEDDGSGNLEMTKVREFGAFSGGDNNEIEAVAVDDPLGYIYYSDEAGGVHKYLADPDAPDANVELALFGTTGFTQDREGISIYQIDDTTGYILVSDQHANRFRIFPREGAPGNSHDHQEITSVLVSTNESDGSELTSMALGDRFPSGLFVAMSDNKTFHLYSWEDIAGETLKKAPRNQPVS